MLATRVAIGTPLRRLGGIAVAVGIGATGVVAVPGAVVRGGLLGERTACPGEGTEGETCSWRKFSVRCFLLIAGKGKLGERPPPSVGV